MCNKLLLKVSVKTVKKRMGKKRGHRCRASLVIAVMTSTQYKVIVCAVIMFFFKKIELFLMRMPWIMTIL